MVEIGQMSDGAVGLGIWQREQQVKQLQAEIVALYQELEIRKIIRSREQGPVEEVDSNEPMGSD